MSLELYVMPNYILNQVDTSSKVFDYANVIKFNYFEKTYCRYYTFDWYNNKIPKRIKKLIVTGDYNEVFPKLVSRLKNSNEDELFIVIIPSIKTNLIANCNCISLLSVFYEEIKIIEKTMVNSPKIIIRTDKNEYEIVPKVENDSYVFDLPNGIKAEKAFLYSITE